MLNNIGVVIIGRNEGDRLIRCLKSILSQSNQLVYVDSASADNSVNMALQLGAKILSLDLAMPFTAARARNEGFDLVRRSYPSVEFVQFVDGDCEMQNGWLAAAAAFLIKNRDVAAVCGRRRERYPEQTVYNMLCDSEWNTPIGETRACGGDVMMRVSAFRQVNGFRSSMIAGEEPELCVRLRKAGWKIWRLDVEMTLHDAAMTRFGQWWKRTLRAGYAFAEGAHLHGNGPDQHGVRESRRAFLWALWVPSATVILSWLFGVWGISVLLVYPAQILRLALRGTQNFKNNWWCALFLVLGKFPEAMGQAKFMYDRLSGRTARLIEYK
jgi:glycosyltransferase involved in cell wall biosynthesis